jgi:hypothetical protein
MPDKFYTIKVGNSEPQMVLRGNVNKKNGQPQGKVETGSAVMGGYAIPNFSIIWAKPEIVDGKRTGKFEPMAWGTPGGEAMEIRYMPACPSLDKAYQKQVGLIPKDDDAEIFLEIGISEHDSATKPQLVQMLKLHTANGDSPCRNPENAFILYTEYDEMRNITTQMKEDEILYEAMTVVMEAKDNPRKLRVLAVIYGIPQERKDKLISTELMAKLRANPLKFNEQRNNYLRHCQQVLIKGRDYQVLDLSIGGEVRISGQPTPILQDIPLRLSGDKKLEYMMENITSPDVFAAIEAIKKAVDQKESALN